MEFAVLGVLMLVGLALLIVRFGAKAKLVHVVNPRFGLLNLLRDRIRNCIAEDLLSLTPILGSPVESTGVAPKCDVLFLYCSIDADGSLINSPRSLREIIGDAGAKVVVIASENPGDRYVSAVKQNRASAATNLVCTLDRKGDAFPKFFAKLFAEMKNGVPMPMAWATLAPQAPGAEHRDCPDTIFACEAGQVVFK